MAFPSRTRIALPRRALVCAALLTLAAALSAQTADWKLYPYAADGFQAAFPGLPEIQKKDVPTEAGPLELRSYTVQLGSTILYIGVCDYGAAAAGRTTEQMLEGAKNGALINSGARLKEEKSISLDGNPGVAFDAQSDSAQFTARIYLRGTTMYQTIVVTPLGKPDPDAIRFFQSFEFIEKSAN